MGKRKAVWSGWLTNGGAYSTLLLELRIFPVEKGLLKKGEVVSRKPTIAEIALEAGVSLPTVSRVLNERPDVAPETRQRVLDVLAARGYHKK
jgi:hypothetical protein